MKPGLPIARLLAAMILAIVAWAVPSTGRAHDGYNHDGHHHDGRHAAGLHHAPAARGIVAPGRNGLAAVTPAEAITALTAALLPDEADRADRIADGLCCCAACCAPGILAAGVTLPGPASGRTRLRPADASARPSLGPASPSEPPRPLA